MKAMSNTLLPPLKIAWIAWSTVETQNIPFVSVKIDPSGLFMDALDIFDR
jgi:hypothetical protein